MKRFLIGLAFLLASAAPALAALPCSAYPYTLTNGTLADANQVMANFNNVLNCVNGLSPIGVPVVGSVSNVKASVPSASASVTVTADSVIVGTALNGTAYTLTSYSQPFNGATTGAGGMDTGTLPGSTWVALYAIYNPTALAISILGTSCATSCPTIYSGGSLPAGYTASALLTVFPTNATPAFPASTYARGKNVMEFAVATLTTASPHTITSLSMTTSVPPNAIAFSGNMNSICGTTPGSNNVALTIFGDGNSNNAFQNGGGCASVNGAVFPSTFSNVTITTAQTTWYSNAQQGSAASSTIQTIGYLIP
jgi:hypothetical protein